MSNNKITEETPIFITKTLEQIKDIESKWRKVKIPFLEAHKNSLAGNNVPLMCQTRLKVNHFEDVEVHLNIIRNQLLEIAKKNFLGVAE